MANLKVGDIRRFSIYMNFFDAVVVHVNKRESYYDVYQANGLKRAVPFGNVAGKAQVTPEQRQIMLQIAKEYDEMLEANRMVMEYKSKSNRHSGAIERLQLELGYTPINPLE